MPYPLASLPFPVLYLGYGIRYVERPEALRFVNENTLDSYVHPMWTEFGLAKEEAREDNPQYLRDASGAWHRVVNARRLGKAPFPRRYQIDVAFDLEPAAPPVEGEALYRAMPLWFEGNPASFRAARALVAPPPPAGPRLPMEALALPALHTDLAFFRVADDAVQASTLREAALPAQKPGDLDACPEYFWDAEDRWFRAVEIEKIRRAPFAARYVGIDDLMVARYQLLSVDPPLPESDLARDLLSGVQMDLTKKALTAAKAELRACRHSRDFTAWILRYDRRPRF
jgi:hypothetical protein